MVTVCAAGFAGSAISDASAEDSIGSSGVDGATGGTTTVTVSTTGFGTVAQASAAAGAAPGGASWVCLCSRDRGVSSDSCFGSYRGAGDSNDRSLTMRQSRQQGLERLRTYMHGPEWHEPKWSNSELEHGPLQPSSRGAGRGGVCSRGGCETHVV